jgi:Cu(I)/Ag(I) efflux system membrane protein CusA/SilA
MPLGHVVDDAPARGATPDLSETQVIILSRWDRRSDIIEDQVTYPIIAALTGARAGKGCKRHFRFRFLLRVRDL